MNVVVIVPDAGLLISLGRADRLTLLLKLNCPVHVVDQVKFEATKDERFPDAARIETFIRDHSDMVHEFVTAVGVLGRSEDPRHAAHRHPDRQLRDRAPDAGQPGVAATRRAAGESRQPGQGEAAIAEVLNRMEEVTGDPDAPVLLLYEDSDVRRGRFVLPENVHVLSTWGLLLGLERRGLIPSARDVWREIEVSRTDSVGRQCGQARRNRRSANPLVARSQSSSSAAMVSTAAEAYKGPRRGEEASYG